MHRDVLNRPLRCVQLNPIFTLYLSLLYPLLFFPCVYSASCPLVTLYQSFVIFYSPGLSIYLFLLRLSTDLFFVTLNQAIVIFYFPRLSIYFLLVLLHYLSRYISYRLSIDLFLVCYVKPINRYILLSSLICLSTSSPLPSFNSLLSTRYPNNFFLSIVKFN